MGKTRTFNARGTPHLNKMRSKNNVDGGVQVERPSERRSFPFKKVLQKAADSYGLAGIVAVRSLTSFASCSCVT